VIKDTIHRTIRIPTEIDKFVRSVAKKEERSYSNAFIRILRSAMSHNIENQEEESQDHAEQEAVRE